MNRASQKRTLLAFPYIFWIIAFTLIPVLILFWYAFTDAEGAFTLKYLAAVFQKVHLKSLWMSVRLSFVCTVLCLLIAYPLSLCMRSLKISRKWMLTTIVIIPMWMNFVLRIMSWQLILSKNGILNRLFSMLSLPPQNLANSGAAIVIGMVYDFLPFMLLPIYNSVMDVEEDVLEAARDLGAGTLTVIFKILVPLNRPGIISGITMVFVPALTTFAISDMLGGGKVMLIGNIIEQEFLNTMNTHLGSGLSLILMVFILIGMLFSFRLERDQEEYKAKSTAEKEKELC
ncbi:MAG: ABC transporter permease [Lachnospiraceae bacterium]|nr:ABC transporter permease [Lachnospiraceae bacterium]